MCSVHLVNDSTLLDFAVSLVRQLNRMSWLWRTFRTAAGDPLLLNGKNWSVYTRNCRAVCELTDRDSRIEMQKQVLNRIEELGGRFMKPRSDTVKDYILSIQFPHVLYSEEWDFCGVDKYFTKNRTIFNKSESAFFDKLEREFFAHSETPRGQTFWKKKLFTPLTPGTDDYQIWASDFQGAKFVDLKPLRKIYGHGDLEFIQIAFAYGYPDPFYVCLQDPKPKNPTVFGFTLAR